MIGRVWGFAILLLFQTGILSAQQNLDLVGFLPYSEALSDVWGYVAPDSTEYALVGAFNGVSIVSLADPSSPVEFAFLPGFSSIWRDLKIWKDFAYVTNETGGGLAILDLSGLPASVDTSSYRGRDLWSAHNLFIDSNGIAYIFGANIDAGGVTMLDLNINPLEPEFVGAYDLRYVHDGYVRNDTLYTADVKDGEFSVVDVRDKSNPLVLGTQKTPIGLTHNVWLSDDGHTLAVSEEYFGGNILTYDVQDPTDINELGQFRSNWNTNIIPHNVYYQGNWLVTSYYRDGVILTDATRPQNLVETGRFDTSPFPSDGEFNGCWGVYPFLPSGHILATDIEEGLFVLQPRYTRGAYLEGTVRESLTGNPRLFARIEILGTNARQYITDLTGQYRTGTADSGHFTVRVTASGCETSLFPDVLLVPGQITTLNAELSCTSTGLADESSFQSALVLQPNVFSGNTLISWDLGASWTPGSVLSCFDATGRVIERVSLTQEQGLIPIGQEWPAGLYLIHMSNGLEHWWKKAVKLD